MGFIPKDVSDYLKVYMFRWPRLARITPLSFRPLRRDCFVCDLGEFILRTLVRRRRSVGGIPPQLGGLTALMDIHLQSNKLSGMCRRGDVNKYHYVPIGPKCVE